MTPFDAERQVDPLGDFWNEVVAGRPATPDDLDPDLAATVRRLQADGTAPAPDPAFAARLCGNLMSQSFSARPTLLSPDSVPPAPPNGRPTSPARAATGGVVSGRVIGGRGWSSRRPFS